MSNWNKIGKPIVVLCLICVVIPGALAATNSARQSKILVPLRMVFIVSPRCKACNRKTQYCVVFRNSIAPFFRGVHRKRSIFPTN